MPRPKAYVIPIGESGVAYLGVKALESPYPDGDGTVYCPGCPTIFGGNVERGQTVAETLYREARQESHCKIDLNQTIIEEALRPGVRINSFVEVYNSEDPRREMTFYVLKGDFVYDPNPRTPSVILGRPEFRETTGAIVRVPLRGKNFDRRRRRQRPLSAPCRRSCRSGFHRLHGLTSSGAIRRGPL